jgi:hypothetical protein
MPSARLWEKDLEMARALEMAITMWMAVLMKVKHPPFVVSKMYLVGVPVMPLHINHCKMEAVTVAAALKMGRLWRVTMVQGLGQGRFP